MTDQVWDSHAKPMFRPNEESTSRKEAGHALGGYTGTGKWTNFVQSMSDSEVGSEGQRMCEGFHLVSDDSRRQTPQEQPVGKTLHSSATRDEAAEFLRHPENRVEGTKYSDLMEGKRVITIADNDHGGSSVKTDVSQHAKEL